MRRLLVALWCWVAAPTLAFAAAPDATAPTSSAPGPGLGLGPDAFGPAFAALGTDVAQATFRPGPQVVVNRYGGNLMAQATDVDLPSLGGFALRFARTHNSGGAQDNAYGKARRLDGPLGLGWTAHYGLVVLHADHSATWHTGTGTRRRFYRHDTLTALQVQSKRPIVRQWIDDELHVLAEHADRDLTLFAPDGQRTTFAWVRSDAGDGHYVAQDIFDDAGNRWSLSYAPHWWHAYPRHPIVRTLQDEEGRTLNFRYQDVAARPRLVQVDLDGKALSTYNYRAAPEGAYLTAHVTPAGRRTSYSYHAAGSQLGALAGLTLPTGGQYAFGYVQRAFFFPGHKAQNLVIDSLRRGADTWRFHYPTETSSTDTFAVRTQGPDGYTAEHVYYSYAQGRCSGTQSWQVGRLKSTTATLDATTHVQTYAYAPLTLSTTTLHGPCPHQPAAAARMVQRTDTRDGHTHTVHYGAFNYLAPGQVDGPGNRRERRDVFNLLRQDLYRLAAPASRTVQVGGDVVEKVVYGAYNALARPSEIKFFRTSELAIAVALSYHDCAGKRGALASKRYGGYSEQFDYRYGQLSKRSFPEGAADVRTVARDGSVTEATQDGITTAYAYDEDGRVVRVSPPLDAPTTLSYRSNDVVVVQGPRRVRYDVDGWGRLSQLSSSIDSGTQVSHFAYDGLGRQVRQVSPLGLITDVIYDVHGRPRRAVHPLRRVDYSYQTRADESRVTTVTNGSVTRVHVEDHAGRPLRDVLNGHEVRTDYRGLTQVVRAGGKVVTRTVDLFGNLVAERRPEFAGERRYHYDARGWLSHADLPGGSVHYRRDGRGRVTEERHHDGGQRSFAYHPRYGQLVAAATADTRRTMTLDSQGRVCALTQTVRPVPLAENDGCRQGGGATPSLTFAASLDYDELGRLVRFDHPYGAMAQAHRYGPGLAPEVQAVALGSRDVVRQATYGPLGTRTGFDLPGAAGAVQHRARYDALGRPTAYGYTGAARFDVTHIAYDDWGFVAQETQHAGDGTSQLRYRYGPQGELIAYERAGKLAGHLAYAYDAHGNLTGRQAAGDAALQLHALHASYDAADHRRGATYDPAGRVVGEGPWTYAYDGFDRLVAATTSEAHLAYAYDASGARVRTSTAQWASYDFRLPDGRLIERVRFAPDAAGCLQREITDYVYLGHHPIAAQVQRGHGAPTWRTELRSPSGTLVALLDEERGAGAAYPKLGPFGEALATQEVTSEHLFAGHPRDVDTGLDDLLARNYAASVGQFTAPDPARTGAAAFPFALNLYAYARNNPVAFADPDGLDWVTNEFGEKVWEGSDAVVPTAAPWEYLQGGRVLGSVLREMGRQGGQAALRALFRHAQRGPAKAPGSSDISSKATRPEDFFEGIKYREHVRRSFGRREFHDFPREVEAFAKDGRVYNIKGGDGVMREHLRIDGRYRGRDGQFEFIKEPDGTLSHRLFRPYKTQSQ